MGVGNHNFIVFNAHYKLKPITKTINDARDMKLQRGIWQELEECKEYEKKCIKIFQKSTKNIFGSVCQGLWPQHFPNRTSMEAREIMRQFTQLY